MTHRTITLTLAACVILIGSHPSISRGDEFDAQVLNGNWKAVSGVLAGREFPQAALDSMVLKIDNLKYVVESAGVRDRGELKVDSSSTPLSMDIISIEGANEGKTILTIFRLQDDKLTVCYNLGEGERPSEFEAPENTQFLLLEYERGDK